MESEGTSPPTITVQVKFAGRSIPVELPAAATTADLKRLLQPLTNVLPRGQRLICKGKVLEDSARLSVMNVVHGSKVMLIASQGLHQGAGPITKNSSSSSTASARGAGASNVKESQAQKPKAVAQKPKAVYIASRSDVWKRYGVVGLQDSNLEEMPEDLWGCGTSIRLLDLSYNCIKEIPHKIAALKSLTKLVLTANDISDENFSWEGLSCLQKLVCLCLSQNRLVNLPSTLGSLTSLRELHLSKNNIESLPIEIGLLKHLQSLIANNNRITSLPSSIGDCESLIEVDLSSNLLTELPEAFGNLHNLKFLHLKNNGLSTLPANFFKKCSQLTTLDLHGTEITNDVLRQMEGWEEFDQRRLQKHQKQLDFRVGSSGVFDEGADDDNKRR